MTFDEKVLRSFIEEVIAEVTAQEEKKAAVEKDVYKRQTLYSYL